MALASRAAVSRPTSSEAARYRAGDPVASEEASVDEDIPRLCRHAQLAPAASAAASADAEAAASEEETEVSGEDSIAPEAAEASVLATEGSALRPALVARPTHLVDLASVEVDTAAVLTVVTAGTTAVVVAAAARTEDATTTSLVVVVVVVADSVVLIEEPPAATQSRLAHDTAARAAPAAVGIATETTGATTPASDLTREAQVTKANANSGDTDDEDDRLSCGGYLESTNFAFLVFTSLSASATRVSRGREAFHYQDLVTLDHTYTYTGPR